jgi:hypothetical protein
MYNPPTIEESIEIGLNSLVGHRVLNSCAFITDDQNDTTIKIPFNPLFSKYKEYFDDLTYTVPLSEKEQNRFRFQPKRVSLEMYGTVDYWSLILYINECPSVIDFEPEKLTLIFNDKISEFINELSILNRR